MNPLFLWRYSSGTLDAQRENNKLTSETNRILRDMSERMKPGTGKFAVATGTLSRSKGISLSLVAESDRVYSAA